jgi:hypothetical protein
VDRWIVLRLRLSPSQMDVHITPGTHASEHAGKCGLVLRVMSWGPVLSEVVPLPQWFVGQHWGWGTR